jgi:hypothetical protein
MKDLCSKFLSLLCYVPYIVDEKPKIQRFLSCLPSSYKDRIEFDNPKTLEETMRKAKLVLRSIKIEMRILRIGMGKRLRGLTLRRKGELTLIEMLIRDFKEVISSELVNLSIMPEIKGTKPPTFFNKETAQKETVKCWECSGPHYYKDCPLRNKGNNNVQTVQEATTVGELARSTPKITQPWKIDRQIIRLQW